MSDDKSLKAQINSENNLEAALAYAQLGFSVVPLNSIKKDGTCTCSKADCSSPGKHPIASLAKHGVKDASSDPEIIKSWFEGRPWANLAIAMSETLAGIDVDPRNGGAGSMRQMAIDEPSQDWQILTKTPSVRTGGGGWHYYVTPAPGLRSAHQIGRYPGVEYKLGNSMLVAPPSLHVSGKRYSWYSPPTLPMLKTPAPIVKLLSQLSVPTTPVEPVTPYVRSSELVEKVALLGGNWPTRLDRYVESSVSTIVGRLSSASPGTHQAEFYRAAISLYRLANSGLIEESQVPQIAKGALSSICDKHPDSEMNQSLANAQKYALSNPVNIGIVAEIQSAQIVEPKVSERVSVSAPRQEPGDLAPTINNQPEDLSATNEATQTLQEFYATRLDALIGVARCLVGTGMAPKVAVANVLAEAKKGYPQALGQLCSIAAKRRGAQMASDPTYHLGQAIHASLKAGEPLSGDPNGALRLAGEKYLDAFGPRTPKRTIRGAEVSPKGNSVPVSAQNQTPSAPDQTLSTPPTKTTAPQSNTQSVQDQTQPTPLAKTPSARDQLLGTNTSRIDNVSNTSASIETTNHKPNSSERKTNMDKIRREAISEPINRADLEREEFVKAAQRGELDAPETDEDLLEVPRSDQDLLGQGGQLSKAQLLAGDETLYLRQLSALAQLVHSVEVANNLSLEEAIVTSYRLLSSQEPELVDAFELIVDASSERLGGPGRFIGEVDITIRGLASVEARPSNPANALDSYRASVASLPEIFRSAPKNNQSNNLTPSPSLTISNPIVTPISAPDRVSGEKVQPQLPRGYTRLPDQLLSGYVAEIAAHANYIGRVMHPQISLVSAIDQAILLAESPDWDLTQVDLVGECAELAAARRNHPLGQDGASWHVGNRPYLAGAVYDFLKGISEDELVVSANTYRGYDERPIRKIIATWLANGAPPNQQDVTPQAMDVFRATYGASELDQNSLERYESVLSSMSHYAIAIYSQNYSLTNEPATTIEVAELTLAMLGNQERGAELVSELLEVEASVRDISLDDARNHLIESLADQIQVELAQWPANTSAPSIVQGYDELLIQSGVSKSPDNRQLTQIAQLNYPQPSLPPIAPDKDRVSARTNSISAQEMLEGVFPESKFDLVVKSLAQAAKALEPSWPQRYGAAECVVGALFRQDSGLGETLVSCASVRSGLPGEYAYKCLVDSVARRGEKFGPQNVELAHDLLSSVIADYRDQSVSDLPALVVDPSKSKPRIPNIELSKITPNQTKLSSQDQRLLIAQLRFGDETSKNQAAEQLVGAGMAIANQYIGTQHLNPYLAEEATASSLEAIVESLGSYDLCAPSSFTTYAHWRIQSAVRREVYVMAGGPLNEQYQSTSLDDYDSVDDEIVDPHEKIAGNNIEDPEEKAQASFDAARLEQLVSTLSPVEVAIFRARAGDDHGPQPWRKLANQMHMTTTETRATYIRACHNLVSKIAGNGTDEQAIANLRALGMTKELAEQALKDNRGEIDPPTPPPSTTPPVITPRPEPGIGL